jgi:dolichyl-phosphate-mannose-protein mannosyltransferase
LLSQDDEDLHRRVGNTDRKPKKMNFFSKFIQLQDLMFAHNAGLIASHPYASPASSWPFARKGISFWTNNEAHKQIYLIGNLVGWWVAAGSVFLIFGIFPADLFARRRGISVLSDCKDFSLFFAYSWVNYLSSQLLRTGCGIHAGSSL